MNRHKYIDGYKKKFAFLEPPYGYEDGDMFTYGPGWIGTLIRHSNGDYWLAHEGGGGLMGVRGITYDNYSSEMIWFYDKFKPIKYTSLWHRLKMIFIKIKLRRKHWIGSKQFKPGILVLRWLLR